MQNRSTCGFVGALSLIHIWFRFVNIYLELEMSSRFVDTHRDVSQGGDGVQLHSHTFYEMIYCTGGSTQYLLGCLLYTSRCV